MLQKLSNSNGCGESSVTNKKIQDLTTCTELLQTEIDNTNNNVATNAASIQNIKTCLDGGVFDHDIEAPSAKIDNLTSTNINGVDWIYSTCPQCNCPVKIGPEVCSRAFHAAQDVTAGNVSLVDTDTKATNALAESCEAKAWALDACCCVEDVYNCLVDYKNEIQCGVTTCSVYADNADITNARISQACLTDAYANQIRTDIIDNRAIINCEDGFIEPTVKDATEFYHIHLPTKFQGRARFVGVDANDEQIFSAIFDTSFSNKLNHDREGTALVIHSGATKWDFYQVFRRRDLDQLSFVTQSNIVKLYYHYDNLDKTDIPVYEILPNLTDQNIDPTLYDTIYTAEHSDQIVIMGNEDTLNGGLTVFGTFYATAFEVPETEVANVRVKCQIYGGFDCDTGEFETCGTPGGLITFNQRCNSGECNVSWINGCPRQVVRKGVCYDQDAYGHECSYLGYEDVIHETTEYNPDRTDSLFDETSLANYSGKTADCCYPISHLNACTCVHGEIDVADKVVTTCIKTPTGCSLGICSDNKLLVNVCDQFRVDATCKGEYISCDTFFCNGGNKTERVVGDRRTQVCGCEVDLFEGSKYECICGKASTISCCGIKLCAPFLELHGDATFTDRVKLCSCVDSGLTVTGDIRGKENVIAEKDLVVHGDMLVNGTMTATNESQVATSGNYVVTRENNPTSMVAGEYAGTVVNNNGAMLSMVTDCDGTWRASNGCATITCYTDVSNYDGCFYCGLTQVSVTGDGPVNILTDIDAIELTEVVKDTNDDYYHKVGSEWFGPLSVVSGEFDLGSLIEDETKITELEALTQKTLVYYNSVVDNKIVQNATKPIVCSQEFSCFHNNDLLVFDKANNKVTNAVRPNINGTTLVAQLDSNNCVIYCWKQAAASVFRYTTLACAQAALNIAEGCDGYVPDNSIVVIDCETGYVTGEDR